MRLSRNTGSSPLGCLGGLLALVCAPWLFQRYTNREARMDVSRFDEESERLWRKIGLIAAGVLAAVFILGWRAGFFRDWLHW